MGKGDLRGNFWIVPDLRLTTLSASFSPNEAINELPFYFSVSAMLRTIQLLPHVFLLSDGRGDASTVQTGCCIVLSLQRLGERGGRVDWTGFEAKSLLTGRLLS